MRVIIAQIIHALFQEEKAFLLFTMHTPASAAHEHSLSLVTRAEIYCHCHAAMLFSFVCQWFPAPALSSLIAHILGTITGCLQSDKGKPILDDGPDFMSYLKVSPATAMKVLKALCM